MKSRIATAFPARIAFIAALMVALTLTDTRMGTTRMGFAQENGAAEPTQIPATSVVPTTSGENGSDLAATEAAAAAAEEAATAEMMDAFEKTAPPELLKEGLAALKTFEAASVEFNAKVLEMRRQYIYCLNGYSDDREAYRVLRNESRDLMNRTYRAALDVIGILPHPKATRMVVTVIEQRVKHDVYDRETYEGAAKLLDFGVRLRYVALAMARAAVSTGDFALAESLYMKLDADELEDKDKSFIVQMEELKRQFAVEQELLKNDPDDLPQVRLLTTRGEIVADLYIHQAPSTVAHFITLVESGFYDGLDYFQVVDGLLALTGDPLGDGSTRPDRFLADEHDREDRRMPLAGSLVMAKLPAPNKEFVPNTGGTQFASLFMPLPIIADQQTVFGRITKGLDVLGSFRRVDPHKEKKKGEVLAPPDRIIKAEILNRPATLPEVQFADPLLMLP